MKKESLFKKKIEYWTYDKPSFNKKVVTAKKSFDEVKKIINSK